MKKLIITTTMILALTLGGIAQEGGGMLRRSSEYEEARNSNRMGGNAPMFPSQHNLNDDQNADGPIGSGIAVLVGLGAAYLVGKKRREE